LLRFQAQHRSRLSKARRTLARKAVWRARGPLQPKSRVDVRRPQILKRRFWRIAAVAKLRLLANVDRCGLRATAKSEIDRSFPCRKVVRSRGR
jgi:hypothetical protein